MDHTLKRHCLTHEKEFDGPAVGFPSKRLFCFGVPQSPGKSKQLY